MPSNGDAQFWKRMTSLDCALDSPGMSSSNPDTSGYNIDVIIASAAGKPLLHFGHIGSKGNSQPGVTTRSLEELVSLSAACVAFRHATNCRIRSVVSPSGIILSTSFEVLHVTVSASDRSLPLDFLVALAKVSVSGILFLLSTGFVAALERRPTLDFGSKADFVQQVSALFLRRGVLYPLSCSFDASVILPCPANPDSLSRLGSMLTSALHSQVGLTHALVFSASPPFPHRLISSVAPVHSQLSAMDIFLISALLPTTAKQKPVLPDRVFLQESSFRKASMLFARLVELRLAFDDFSDFRTSVGGDDWRPDWSGDGAGSIWMVCIGDLTAERGETLQKSGDAFLRDMENKLDRDRTSKGLMVYLERPLRVSDISPLIHPIRGVIVLHRQRLVATVGALDHKTGLVVLQSLKHREEMRLEKNSSKSPLEPLYILLPGKVAVVSEPGRYVFVDAGLEETQAISLCKQLVFPWISANILRLFPSESYVTLAPNTPLSALFAPFQS